MIDLASESLIPLRDVPRHLPPRPNGKRLHISAVYRWARRGVRGIILETIRMGGSTYTSREALQRFGDGAGGTPDAAGKIPTPRAREREINRATEQVRDLLGPASNSPEPDMSKW